MALAGSLLLCLLFGGLLERAVFPVPRAGAIERFGRALLFGFGGVGCVSLLLDAGGVPVRAFTLLPALALLGACLAVCLLRARRRRVVAGASPLPTRTPSSPGERLACAGLLLVAALSLVQPLASALIRPAFQFDALTRWLLKTKVLAFEGTLRGSISTDPGFAFTHQRYPPLMPHVCNLPALFSGHWDERAAAGLCAWFAVALVAVVYGALLRHGGALKAALGAAWIASLPLVQYLPSPPAGAGAFSALADIPLALFVTGAGLALLDALLGGRDHAQLEVGLLLGCAALTKNEGLPLLAGAALALLCCAPAGRWRRTVGVTGSALALYWIAWGWLAQGFPALDEHYPGRLNLDALLAGCTRLPAVLAGFGTEFVSIQRWNLSWFAVPAFLVLGRVSRPVTALLILVGVQLLSYVLAYVITSWTSPAAQALGGADPVNFLMSLTLGRLLLQVAPLAIAASLLAAPRLARRSVDCPGFDRFNDGSLPEARSRRERPQQPWS